MKRWHKLEVWAESVMRGHQNGVAASFFRSAMTPISWGYGAAVRCRLRPQGVSLPRPVISVGNVVAGGTGKSDVVTLLAQSLPGRVAIVSRGYRGALTGPLVVKEQSAAACGDEPRMLADRLPEAVVCVGRDRVAAARLAIKGGADWLILDDGMQHHRLARDWEIAVVDGSNPFGGGYFLPKGLLRDDPNRLKEADLVVVTGKKIALPGCRTVHMERAVDALYTLQGERVEGIANARVALFCAIANPHRFVRTVEQLGAKVVDTLFLPDHCPFQEEALSRLLTKSGARYLVCTEKDRVKLAPSRLPILWTKQRLFIDENVQEWHTLLEKIRERV